MNKTSMQEWVKIQDLSELYTSQVDANLFNKNTDYTRDGVALVFSQETGFSFFCDFNTHNPHQDAITYVDAEKAITSSLEEIVEEYESVQPKSRH